MSDYDDIQLEDDGRQAWVGMLVVIVTVTLSLCGLVLALRELTTGHV